jgi:hypothetical protein
VRGRGVVGRHRRSTSKSAKTLTGTAATLGQLSARGASLPSRRSASTGVGTIRPTTKGARVMGEGCITMICVTCGRKLLRHGELWTHGRGVQAAHLPRPVPPGVWKPWYEVPAWSGSHEAALMGSPGKAPEGGPHCAPSRGPVLPVEPSASSGWSSLPSAAAPAASEADEHGPRRGARCTR